MNNLVAWYFVCSIRNKELKIKVASNLTSVSGRIRFRGGRFIEGAATDGDFGIYTNMFLGGQAIKAIT